MTQTWALFVDAYRELNSRKLFWTALVISALGVAVAAGIGIDSEGVSFFGYGVKNPFLNSNIIPPATFYKLLFSDFGVDIWLTWCASILALVSTAGIVPELVAGGSIDMMISKPLGRGRLFLTRWCTGLLFVAVQAAVFSGACFLVVGIRGRAWEPSLFMAVPIVVIVFSYLFCVCALVGLVTRNAIASLIITLLFWMLVFAAQRAEWFCIRGKLATKLEIDALAMKLIVGEGGGFSSDELEQMTEEMTDLENNYPKWETAHAVTYWLVTCLPKTSETTDWLQRHLVKSAQLRAPADPSESIRVFGLRHAKRLDFDRALYKDAEDRKNAAWVMGTSLCFEAAVLGVCVWIFRRRDF